METANNKAAKLKSKITQEEYIRLFRTFSRKKKLQIAEEINQELFEELWEKTNLDLPDIADLDKMILEEVKAVRYGKSG
jgi:hypothetical protein